MAGMSKGKKTAVIVISSMAGVLLVGAAAAALAVGAVVHHREGRGFGWGGCDSEDEVRGTSDGDTGATPGKRGMESGDYFDEAADALAETLGMSSGELQDQLAAGRNVMDIAAERGVSLEAMVDSVVRVTGEILDEEVEEGDLSPGMVEAIIVEVTDYTAWSLEHGGAWLRREHAYRH